ncbi:zona pellucida sperm-binding protein 1-like isoform X2 [Gymnodraco acuticeps]|uniref:Zona pellucida sperm-binding protein 4 n=1 Tax=Gymnodraco acuticeps TaxID=8218 RepID=A0A6P8TQD1_GYMAC|nr:zona pellucida sperm-binding protein 1-like isoform X2 [Gymnodraco acuticeps]
MKLIFSFLAVALLGCLADAQIVKWTQEPQQHPEPLQWPKWHQDHQSKPPKGPQLPQQPTTPPKWNPPQQPQQPTTPPKLNPPQQPQQPQQPTTPPKWNPPQKPQKPTTPPKLNPPPQPTTPPKWNPPQQPQQPLQHDQHSKQPKRPQLPQLPQQPTTPPKWNPPQHPTTPPKWNPPQHPTTPPKWNPPQHPTTPPKWNPPQKPQQPLQHDQHTQQPQWHQQPHQPHRPATSPIWNPHQQPHRPATSPIWNPHQQPHRPATPPIWNPHQHPHKPATPPIWNPHQHPQQPLQHDQHTKQPQWHQQPHKPATPPIWNPPQHPTTPPKWNPPQHPTTPPKWNPHQHPTTPPKWNPHQKPQKSLQHDQQPQQPQQSQQPPQPKQPPWHQKPHQPQQSQQTCEVADNQKISCGAPGISTEHCEAINCCYGGNMCYYGKSVTLQCTKDGQFIVVVAKDATLPYLDLETVFFLGGGETCHSVGTTSAFAIYQFPVTACGTVMMEEPGVIIYENRMSSSYEVAIGPNGAITRDSQYELLVQCRYIGTAIEALVIEVGILPPPLPVAAPGPLRVELVLANGECSVKGCVEEDVAYNSFYVDSDYPVTKVLRDPVYVEVHILERTDPNIKLTLGKCWATSDPYPQSLPQWDLLIDGCPYRDDRYLTTLVPVDASSGLMYPTHHRRFVFKMFTFVSGGGVKQQALIPLNEKVYIHCEAAVCQPSVGDNCEPRCFRSRRDVSVQKASREETTVVSSKELVFIQ